MTMTTTRLAILALELAQATIETPRLAIPALELAPAIPETERLAMPALELEQAQGECRQQKLQKQRQRVPTEEARVVAEAEAQVEESGSADRRGTSSGGS